MSAAYELAFNTPLSVRMAGCAQAASDNTAVTPIHNKIVFCISYLFSLEAVNTCLQLMRRAVSRVQGAKSRRKPLQPPVRTQPGAFNTY